MNTQSTLKTNCYICGHLAAGKRGRVGLCHICASRISRSEPRYVFPGFKPNAPAAASDDVNTTTFRLITTCSCSKAFDFSGQALGMTIACPDCGEKILLTEKMKMEPIPTSSITTRANGEFELSKYPELPKKRIGELLVEAKTISTDQLEEGLSLQQGQGGRLVDNLVLLGYLNRDEFQVFLAQLTGIRSIELRNCKLDAETLALIPLHFGLDYEVCPIEQLGPLLTVGMACPHDIATLHKVETLTRLKVTAFLCHPNEIVEALRYFHPQRNDPAFRA